METNSYPPSPALAPYIVSYQMLEFKASALSPIGMMDFPRTSMDMVFCFDGQIQLNIVDQPIFNLSQSAFVGHFDKPYQIRIAQDSTFLHVKFKPNGIYPLTKIPLTQLLNTELSVVDLIDRRIDSVYNQMLEKKSAVEKIEILESFLIQQYQVSNLHYRLDTGIELIRKNKGLLSIKELTQNLNTNYKSLDRWFTKNVGLSPKRFSNITRFKNILEEIEKNQQPNWMDIVERYQFHDQSHFIKEFKRFSGISPTELKLQSNLNFSER